MYHRTTVTIIFAAALILPMLGCGPNCQKIISTKTPEDLSADDATRVNGLVERRKSAMEAAKDANQYMIEDAKNTVTACEMAIEIQYQVINLQKAGSKLVEENQKKINEFRCYLDGVLLSKGKLIGAGKGAFISSSDVRTIRGYHEEIRGLLGNEGTVSERRMVNVYENGVDVPNAKKADDKSTEKEGEVDESEEDVDEFGESPSDESSDSDASEAGDEAGGGMDDF